MPSSSGRARYSPTVLIIIALLCVCEATHAFSMHYGGQYRKLGDVDVDEELFDFDEEGLVTEMRRLVSSLKPSNRNSSFNGEKRELFAGPVGQFFCLKGLAQATSQPNPYAKK
jgi:hypothetical protein